MFKLLSKESNIFSIPIYIGFLLMIIVSFNVLNFNSLNAVTAIITFSGIALAYFLLNKINLNNHNHLPLFLYTFFIFGLYPGNIDLGLAISLFTNSFLLFLLTSTDDRINRNAYVLVGSILTINFLFMPTTWPMLIFVILHIIGTSPNIGLNLFRLFFGSFLILLSYFSLMYYRGYTTFDPNFFPHKVTSSNRDLYPYYYLFPIGFMYIMAIFDHFRYYSVKSPSSRYKFTFLVVFSLAQLTTIFLYMGDNSEYLLLLAFPFSIILSKYLKFLPKYWMRELSLWLIIFCLITYKMACYFDIDLFK